MEESELFRALDAYFNRGIDTKRFIDTSRIPFICDDIKGIRRAIDTKNLEYENRIKSLEITRAQQSGFVMSRREIISWVVALLGVAAALAEAYFTAHK